MFDKKINWTVYFFLVLFGGFFLILPKSMYLLISDQVTMEDGLPMPFILRLLILVVGTLASSTYLITFISSLKRVFVYKRTAFKVDEYGIHNAMIFINFLAFFLFLNVKYIPWGSVSFVSNDKNTLYIRVKVDQVSASFLGKIILKILGFNFCQGLINKKLTEEEINVILSYCKNKSQHLKTDN